jgi:hypothetical protein
MKYLRAVSYIRDMLLERIINSFISTAGVLDFMGCAWWPFVPPVGMWIPYS